MNRNATPSWFNYICRECKNIDSVLRDLGEEDIDPVCCGASMFLKQIVVSGENRIRQNRVNSFWSNTMGCSPEQVDEERKLHPDWNFHDDGRVLIEGLQDQRNKCKALGMTNFDDVR